MELEEIRALASPSQPGYNAYNHVRAGSPNRLLGAHGPSWGLLGGFWMPRKLGHGGPLMERRAAQVRPNSGFADHCLHRDEFTRPTAQAQGPAAALHRGGQPNKTRIQSRGVSPGLSAQILTGSTYSRNCEPRRRGMTIPCSQSGNGNCGCAVCCGAGGSTDAWPAAGAGN